MANPVTTMRALATSLSMTALAAPSTVSARSAVTEALLASSISMVDQTPNQPAPSTGPEQVSFKSINSDGSKVEISTARYDLKNAADVASITGLVAGLKGDLTVKRGEAGIQQILGASSKASHLFDTSTVPYVTYNGVVAPRGHERAWHFAGKEGKEILEHLKKAGFKNAVVQGGQIGGNPDVYLMNLQADSGTWSTLAIRVEYPTTGADKMALINNGSGYWKASDQGNLVKARTALGRALLLAAQNIPSASTQSPSSAPAPDPLLAPPADPTQGKLVEKLEGITPSIKAAQLSILEPLDPKTQTARFSGDVTLSIEKTVGSPSRSFEIKMSIVDAAGNETPIRNGTAEERLPGERKFKLIPGGNNGRIVTVMTDSPSGVFNSAELKLGVFDGSPTVTEQMKTSSTPFKIKFSLMDTGTKEQVEITTDVDVKVEKAKGGVRK